MVKLNKVNKYFNRRKKNEIHVINDTSFELESTGLVALLGPSGCGKTTLLNAIGGLDKVGSGQIYIDGQKITGRRSGMIDRIRTLSVGYIFQNYNLVESMTVFDNVAIALRMTGVKNHEEIKEKVNYVLEKVGMYRYRNRYADMLSGGERQRVGIARAIVKNPSIIIADEPTGNLDSRNTIEIMNIIRSISQDKLVIMVTHEEELAQFYASRIMRIKDGSIVSDEDNSHADNLDYRIDNKIYLKDISDHKMVRTEQVDIDFYNDSQTPIKLNIAVKGGNIYIQAKDEMDRIELVDEHSNIELVDDHYREMTKEESLANGFDLMKLEHKSKRKYTSIINPLQMIVKGFKTVFNYPALKKILLAGFLLSAMFVTYAVSNIYGVLDITDDEFVEADKSYLKIVSKNMDVDKYSQYENNENFSYVMPGDSKISLTMNYKDYYQLNGGSATLSGSLSDSSKLKEEQLVYGRLPENAQEIVVDKMVFKSTIEDSNTKSAGFAEAKDFIEQKVTVPDMPDFEIVGISDLQSPCIYADKSIFINMLYHAPKGADGDMDSDEGEGDSSAAQMMDYTLKTGKVSLSKGRWPSSLYEVVVNETNKDEMPLNKTISTKVNGQKLKVVGYYKDISTSNYMLVTNDTVKYDLIKNTSNMTICPVDKDAAFSQLQESGVNVKDTYSDSRQEYVKVMLSYIRSALIMSGIVLLISFIEIFLIMRASFLSRVKEVGVYRAIGVKKKDIYKMFIGEILAITTIASMPGFLFMAYALNKLSGYSMFQDMFLVTPSMLILCVVLLYGFNMLFGLLPVFRTMRKRPAAILSRTDIN